jgi:antitoxin VapB
MVLSIKDTEADRLAREVARAAGETITEAVTKALAERLERLRRRPRRGLVEDLNEIALRCAGLPELESRSAEDIIGYDEAGVPR